MTDYIGTAAGDTLTAKNYGYNKLDGKGGDDLLKGASGNDLLIGGSGNDVMYGGYGSDTFQFSKFAHGGDVDYILDFQLGTDELSFLAGTTIIGVEYGDAGTTTALDLATGETVVGLVNDSKVLDLKLTINIKDGEKDFNQEIWLVDAVKNKSWHEDQWVEYLTGKGASIDGGFIIG